MYILYNIYYIYYIYYIYINIIYICPQEGVETMGIVCKLTNSRPKVLNKNCCSKILKGFQENTRGGVLF